MAAVSIPTKLCAASTDSGSKSAIYDCPVAVIKVVMSVRLTRASRTGRLQGTRCS